MGGPRICFNSWKQSVNTCQMLSCMICGQNLVFIQPRQLKPCWMENILPSCKSTYAVYEAPWHIKWSMFRAYYIKNEQLTWQISKCSQNVADISRNKAAIGRHVLYNWRALWCSQWQEYKRTSDGIWQEIFKQAKLQILVWTTWISFGFFSTSSEQRELVIGSSIWNRFLLGFYATTTQTLQDGVLSVCLIWRFLKILRLKLT